MWYNTSMYSHLISTNTKPHLSGVAKFSEIIAGKLSVPFIGFTEIDQLKKRHDGFSICFIFYGRH